MLFIYIKFQFYRFIRYLYGQYSLSLVNTHIKLTPIREDISRDILLDNIRFKQRAVEQKRYKIWVKMCVLAKQLGVDEMKFRESEQLIPLETEGELAKRVNND